MPSPPKLFYALWPDDDVRDALMRMQSRLSNGRMTRYENLHLTLAFLGRQAAASVPLLKKIASDMKEVDLLLTLDRIGYFTRNRIVWAGMHRTPDPLHELHRALTARLLESEISFDRRTEFRPHVTLARDAEAPEDFPFEAVTWRANSVALVESLSQPDGTAYRVLT